ncbi:MAG: leucyl aminopeptidase [Bdellovibrionaceae bacterium]|nr:leucyl aminopeptidase [Pseudobdellovibrionaceae bacterium]
MEISTKNVNQKTTNAKAQTLIEFCYRTSNDKKGVKVNSPNAHKQILLLIEDAIKDGHFSADPNETIIFRNAQLDGYKHVLIVSLGDVKRIGPESIRRSCAAIEKALVKNKVVEADLNTDNLLSRANKNVADYVAAAVEGFLLADYEFDKFINKDMRKKQHPIKTIYFLTSSKTNSSQLQKGLEVGKILSECINFARALGDTPGNLLTPEILGQETIAAAKGTKLKVQVWDEARIKKERMGGLWGVGKGSDNGPRFILMEYKGAAASKKPICFVGKGLTFDAGGISIKPSMAMDEMKYDMCGGSTVIATMLAIAKLGLKINAVAYVPASENMLGPSANKPGDILTARNGKTVEVLNTDAEGRLILMDALSYACERKPELIIDVATLTGAIVVSLHNVYTGYFTRNSKLKAKIEKASLTAGERVWQMPLHNEHGKDIKGRHADLQNISNHRGAGSSTAAAFLENFVDKDIPWAHFDIAGTAWDLGGRFNYCPEKGASGVMIRTFVEIAKDF